MGRQMMVIRTQLIYSGKANGETVIDKHLPHTSAAVTMTRQLSKKSHIIPSVSSFVYTRWERQSHADLTTERPSSWRPKLRDSSEAAFPSLYM